VSLPTKLDYIRFIAGEVSGSLLIVGIGGGILEWRAVQPEPVALYLIHAMGLPPSFGLGLALALPHRRILALDGDGGMLMHLGSLPTLGLARPSNLSTIIFDNGCYASTGYVPTAASTTDLGATAAAAGIKSVFRVSTVADFSIAIGSALSTDGPHFVHALTQAGHYDGPVRELDVLENKYEFARAIEAQEGLQLLKMVQPPGLPEN
jgi:pyruvate/2-oxoacid:ferredoxin oxidoreductase beta subunit